MARPDPRPLRCAFRGDFEDTDFEHALGGVHVLLVDGPDLVAHVALVDRWLQVGDGELHIGYVEAVAVDPAHQDRGHGTQVMRAAGALTLPVTVRDRAGDAW